MESLTSILKEQYENLDFYEDLLLNNNMNFEQVGEMSGEILTYTDEELNFRHLNKKGKDWFGLNSEHASFVDLTFTKKHHHPDTLRFELPKIRDYFKNKRLGSTYSNYLQIFSSRTNAFSICLVLFKKIKIMTAGYLTMIIPISHLECLNKKMRRVISEENFRINHRTKFEQLTERESEILRILATGKNNPEISDELFISRHTVEQHRKNINRKLNIHGLKEILDYAYAFDLV